MAQSLRQEFGNELAKMVLDDIQFRRSRYYYFLGGVEPWNGFQGTATGDNAPTDPVNEPDDPTIIQLEQTERINRRYQSEIAFVKQIAPNEVTLACRRVDWTANTAYSQWDHTLDMRATNFYALTDQFNVYKCLDNNGGALSTVKPTGTSIYPIRTADQYLWKYMYTIPPFKRSRFLSFLYMPVQKALSDSFYNNGAIDAAIVVSEGSGYTDQLLTYITVSNTTTGSGAVGTVVVDSGGVGIGAITSVAITNGGTGYTKGVRVVFGGTGSGAQGTAVITGGVITGVTITSGGVGYGLTGTTISFVLGGAEIIPLVSRTTGTIMGVKVIDPGIGYLTAPVLTVVDNEDNGTGKYGNPTAVLTSVVHEGSIRHVNIIDPGVNYTADTATTISVQGDGQSAAFSPVIYNGRVVDVIVENPGSNYTDIRLTVNSAVGAGAIVNGVITQSDYISDQMVIEQTAVKGAIHTVKVTAPGYNYTDTTIVNILGNGTGCIAIPKIEFGRIVEIEIVNPGSNYTYATVEIVDLGRVVIPTGDLAAGYAIVPPVDGHGAAAPSELYADVIAVTTPLRGEMEIEGVNQEFRNYGIVKNPSTLISGGQFRQLSGLLVYKVRFSAVTSLSPDDILKLGNNRYRVLQISGSIVYLIPIDRDDITPVGTLVSENTGLQYLSLETIQSLDYDKYSGTVLYISTENPFSFTEDQSITVKTFIKF